MRRSILFLIAVALLVPVTGAAGAPAQLDARDQPSVSGPLEQRSSQCKVERERFEGDVVAVGKTCLRVYLLDPESETDANRNYGVVWLQSNLNSRNGWCGIKVQSDVSLPSDVVVERRAPRGVTTIGRRKRMTTRITATANGTASTNGVVSAEATVYPREIRSRLLQEPEQVFRLRWVGSSARKLAFASGAEISWPADSAPRGISFRLNYSLKQDARC